jgi:hypothetical protein
MQKLDMFSRSTCYSFTFYNYIKTAAKYYGTNCDQSRCHHGHCAGLRTSEQLLMSYCYLRNRCDILKEGLEKINGPNVIGKTTTDTKAGIYTLSYFNVEKCQCLHMLLIYPHIIWVGDLATVPRCAHWLWRLQPFCGDNETAETSWYEYY